MTLVRRLAFGAAKLTVSNLAVRLLSIVSMPILTRLLDPSAYGTSAMAAAIVSFASVIALAGADVSYIRAYLSERTAPRSAVEIFTWHYALAAALIAAILTLASWWAISRALLLPFYAGWLVALSIVLSVALAMATLKTMQGDEATAYKGSKSARRLPTSLPA